MAQGECASGFSVVLLVQVGGIMLLDARVVAQHCCYVVHFEFCGMLLSYRLVCACAWHAGVFLSCLWPRASAPAALAWCRWSRSVTLCSWMHGLVCLGQVRFGFTSHFWHVHCAL